MWRVLLVLQLLPATPTSVATSSVPSRDFYPHIRQSSETQMAPAHSLALGNPRIPTPTQTPPALRPADSSLPLWSSPTTGAWKRSLESCAHVPGPWSGHYPPPMHSDPALVSSRDTGDRKEGTQRQGNRKTKEERGPGENGDGRNADKKL